MNAPQPLQANLSNLLDMIPLASREHVRQSLGEPGSPEATQRANAMLAQTKEVCDKHGQWHPFVLDAKGRITSQAGLCPTCRNERTQRASYGAMSGVPRLYAEADFSNFEVYLSSQPPSVAALRAYADEIAAGSNKNLVLLGTPGTGKTHLAIAIARHVGAKGRSVTYIGMLDLLDQLRRDRFPTPPQQPGQFADAITSVDLLIIDECGKQTGTESEAVAAQRIIDRRVSNCMPTIVIGNGDIDGVRQMITGAALDRLLCQCSEMTLAWRSYRHLLRESGRQTTSAGATAQIGSGVR